ncbi:MAG: organ-specific protein, partial [Pirellulales bacterium]|nr:organ-specific protein [Pirellulales bacterium]
MDKSTRRRFRDPNKRWQYARGYGGVKRVLANSVGKTKADEIMKAVCSNRDRSWRKTFWTPRNEAITKQQLGDIIQKTRQTLQEQRQSRCLNDRDQQRCFDKIFRTTKNKNIKHTKDFKGLKDNKKIKDFEDIHKIEAFKNSTVKTLGLAEALKDPALKALLHAQAAKDGTTQNIDFLQETEHYDALVKDADRHLKYLIGEGIVDEDGNPYPQDDTSMMTKYEAALRKVKDKAATIRDKYIINTHGCSQITLPADVRRELENFNI